MARIEQFMIAGNEGFPLFQAVDDEPHQSVFFGTAVALDHIARKDG